MKTTRLAILLFTIIIISCKEKTKNFKQKATEKQITNKDSINFESKTIIDSSLIVIDTSSNLTWMKDDFSKLKNRFLNNWNEIFEWQKEINKSNYAGYDDWEIPTIKQYRTINSNRSDRKEYQKKFRAIDSTNVWGNGPYAFWSKTTPNKETASYISFIEGFATSGNRAKQYANKYSSWKGVELGMSVRLVRKTRKLPIIKKS